VKRRIPVGTYTGWLESGKVPVGGYRPMAELLERLTVALASRYRLQRELGQGGMAKVFLAHDLKYDRDVAVKVLRPELAADVGIARFLHEIQVAARLHHPHILPLYDSDQADGLAYYVMPYIRGETLRQRLDRERQLPVAEAIQIAREVADALHYAHQAKLVHRDIKPANILLESGHALVSDFGIARAIDEAQSLTSKGHAIGTPAYMSPEQIDGSERIDGRSDICSLGCVIFEMLVGQPPFRGATVTAIIASRLSNPVPSPRALRHMVPEAVDAAVIKAMAPLPADRFATAAPVRRRPRDSGNRGDRRGGGASHGAGSHCREIGCRAAVREHEHRPRERVLQRRHHRRHHRAALENQRAQGHFPDLLHAV
jgi:serine/threonine-protein kinase